LLGRPPFETNTLKDTYTRIRKGDYAIPGGKVSLAVRSLIGKMLQVDPALRPTARQVLNHEFLSKGKLQITKSNNSCNSNCLLITNSSFYLSLGFIPKTLPSSVLTMPPRFEYRQEEGKALAKRSPLGQQNQQVHSPIPHAPAEVAGKPRLGGEPMGVPFKHFTGQYMTCLYKQLKELMATNPLAKNVQFNGEEKDIY